MDESELRMDKVLTLKARIKNGEMINGIGIPMCSQKKDLERILEEVEFDFFNIDCQHGPQSEVRISELCGAAGELGVPVNLRIKNTRQTYLIGNFLDLGPAGIIVPEVEKKSSVREAVSSFYYPQIGIRSWGGRTRYRIDENSDRVQNASWWNKTGVLWIQLESINAVLNCRKLAIDGVDVVTFGPKDLMFDIESYQYPPFLTLEDCVRYVVREMQDTSVAVSLALQDSSEQSKYRDLGLTILQTPMVV